MLLKQSLQVIQKLDGILVMLTQLAQYGQISALELQMLMLEMCNIMHYVSTWGDTTIFFHSMIFETPMIHGKIKCVY